MSRSVRVWLAACLLAATSCRQTAVVGQVCRQSPCVTQVDAGTSPAAGSCGGRTCLPYTTIDAAGAGGACTSQLALNQRQQLDIYLLVDNSGSLILSWEDVRQALRDFFEDPASAGIGVGMQFFGESCDASDYAKPLVPIAELPENAARLTAAIPLLPVAETPTRPALEGALVYARSWARQQQGHKVIVLLVTDGLPDECDSTVENVTQAASDGFHGSPSVQTFVVGIDSIAGLFEVISAFAEAGGSQPTMVVRDVGSDLLRALTAVRERAREQLLVGCPMD